MPSWVIVLIVIVVVGVAVIAYGFVHDRSANRRRREEMLNPPDRIIPGFGEQQAAPTYVSGLQARRPAAAPTPLAPDERAALETTLAETEPLSVGFAGRDFVTDPERKLAVLSHPIVLVCAEPVQSIRELLPVVEAARTQDTSIVIVAPQMEQAVLDTMAVNRIQQLLKVIVVITPDMDTLFAIAERTGTALVDRSDLQSGYLSPEHVGHCTLWASSAGQTWVGMPSTQPAGSDG